MDTRAAESTPALLINDLIRLYPRSQHTKEKFLLTLKNGTPNDAYSLLQQINASLLVALLRSHGHSLLIETLKSIPQHERLYFLMNIADFFHFERSHTSGSDAHVRGILYLLPSNERPLLLNMLPPQYLATRIGFDNRCTAEPLIRFIKVLHMLPKTFLVMSMLALLERNQQNNYPTCSEHIFNELPTIDHQQFIDSAWLWRLFTIRDKHLNLLSGDKWQVMISNADTFFYLLSVYENNAVNLDNFLQILKIEHLEMLFNEPKNLKKLFQYGSINTINAITAKLGTTYIQQRISDYIEFADLFTPNSSTRLRFYKNLRSENLIGIDVIKSKIKDIQDLLKYMHGLDSIDKKSFLSLVGMDFINTLPSTDDASQKLLPYLPEDMLPIYVQQTFIPSLRHLLAREDAYLMNRVLLALMISLREAQRMQILNLFSQEELRLYFNKCQPSKLLALFPLDKRYEVFVRVYVGYQFPSLEMLHEVAALLISTEVMSFLNQVGIAQVNMLIYNDRENSSQYPDYYLTKLLACIPSHERYDFIVSLDTKYLKAYITHPELLNKILLACPIENRFMLLHQFSGKFLATKIADSHSFLLKFLPHDRLKAISFCEIPKLIATTVLNLAERNSNHYELYYNGFGAYLAEISYCLPDSQNEFMQSIMQAIFIAHQHDVTKTIQTINTVFGGDAEIHKQLTEIFNKLRQSASISTSPHGLYAKEIVQTHSDQSCIALK